MIFFSTHMSSRFWSISDAIRSRYMRGGTLQHNFICNFVLPITWRYTQNLVNLSGWSHLTRAMRAHSSVNCPLKALRNYEKVAARKASDGFHRIHKHTRRSIIVALIMRHQPRVIQTNYYYIVYIPSSNNSFPLKNEHFLTTHVPFLETHLYLYIYLCSHSGIEKPRRPL